MAIAITPTIPSATAVAAGTPASGIVLQAGQVITAEVVQVLGNDQVQIAIGNQTIEATTQVPLQAGQTLQLQVSQTASGIGLAIVNSASSTPTQAANGTASASNAVVLAPSLAASLAANLTPDAVAPANPLTPIETLAVSIAAQTAATQQASLAPLFADLAAAGGSANLPPQVQEAVVQVLAQQTSLDQNLTGSDVKEAFQSSGLFLEASLASGSAISPGDIPDLKAALVVLRQALTTSLADVSATSNPVAPTAATPPESATSPSATPTTPQAALSETATAAFVATGTSPAPVSASAAQSSTASAAAAPASAGQAAVQTLATAVTILSEVSNQTPTVEPTPTSPPIVPQAIAAPPSPAAAAQSPTTAAVASEILDLVAANLNQAASQADPAAARAAATSAAINLLQEVFQGTPITAAGVSNLVLQNGALLSLVPVASGARTSALDDRDFASTNLPPPPISGALPSAQPIAAATFSTHAPLSTVLQHLLADTDGAIARQTLLQIASLPGQAADASAGRIDPSMPRWNFEIPFATAQGTAMAQFEISRDGGGREAAAAKATWRARFSLNVEPAGPVHALVSLNGDRTSVRMWAERPATATQLRAGVLQLSQALTRAELKPGDIVIRDGAPVQPAPAPAGHFLNRAS